MGNLVNLDVIPPFDLFGEDVRARRVEGERITMAVAELAPGAIVPEHRHEAEQLGLVIEGSLTFSIDGETRELGPGGTWRILSGLPHAVVAGPGGAVVVDVFTPVRADWARHVAGPLRPPRWPSADRA